MKRSKKQTWAMLKSSCILLFSFACLIAIGCTEPTSSSSTSGGEEEHHHDHGHRPDSYTEALTQIKHARDEVKAAFDAGTPNECDDALHEVAEVLDVLPEVAAETDLPKEDWQVVKDQSKVLFEQFMKIHNGFHGDGKQGASFESVGSEIDAAIEVLESKLAATGEKVPSGDDDHDHDHDDHDHDHEEHDDHDHDDHDHDHEEHEEHAH